ncbi:MAG: DnaD domain protein [Ruminococcus sp.]|nr:DnaD domain protein [Ruminococcus sp.]
MDYKIDIKQWGKFFSVPCSVVDDYILISDGDFVKVLLCILCSNSDLVSTDKLAKQAGVSADKAEDAIIHWAGLGVISAQSVDGRKVAVNATPKVVKTSTPVSTVEAISPSKSRTDAKTRVRYSTREIAEKIDANDELKALYDDMQTVLKRPINATDMAAILNLYEYYNFSAPSILMIAQYCTDKGKGRIAYIETVAKNWFDKGICSYAEVEAEIIRLEQLQTYENKILNAFGITNKITKRQREFIQSWNDMGFSPEMLEIAYEKCMDNTNKLNFGYINKILQNWSGKNIKTPKQVHDDDKSYTGGKKSKVDTKAKDTSYNLKDLEKLVMNYDPTSNGGNKN